MSNPAIHLRLEQFLDRVNRKPQIGLMLLALFLLIQVSGWWYPAGDSTSYMSVARTMAHGEEIAHLRAPGAGTQPIYSALISPAFWFGDRPILALSVIHFLLALAAMLGVYRWAYRQFPPAALLLTALVVVNIGFTTYYRRTLKEIAFIAFLIWTINLLEPLLHRCSARRTISATLAGGLMMVMLALTRYAGIMVAAGFGVAMIVQARRSQISWTRAVTCTLAVGLPATCAVFGWIRLNSIYTTGGGQEYEFMQPYAATQAETINRDPATTSPVETSKVVDTQLLKERLSTGSHLRLSDMGRLLIPAMAKASPAPGDWWSGLTIVYLVLLVPLTIGWWRQVNRHVDIFALTLPFYLLLYIHWPFEQQGRYMVPMLPALFAGLWYGWEPLFRHRRTFSTMACFCLLITHLAQSVGYWLLIDAPRARSVNRQWSTVDQLAAAIDSDHSYRRRVGIVDVEQSVATMLSIASDRYVVPYDKNGPYWYHWLILPKEAPIDGYQHYVDLGVVEEYRVLRKTARSQRTRWETATEPTSPRPAH